MQTFKMSGDNHRLYFRNVDRVAPDTELKSIISILSEKGVIISDKKPVGLDDIYRCAMDEVHFDIIYTGEETFLYSEEEGCIERLEHMMNANSLYE